MSEYWTMPWDYFGIGAVWLALMCFLVALPCSQLGAFLVMRRMSLVGDAISHSVLPGIVIAFMFVGDLASPWLLIGAAFAGLLVTVIIEQIHRRTRIKQDSAIGIAFTSLFALGVVMLNVYLKKIHLDAQCILEGQIGDVLNYDGPVVLGYTVPEPIVTMTVVCLLTLLLVAVFYRVLLLTSFDSGLAASFGYRPAIVHYCLMGFLSVVVVAAFQAVGAILVIALLILPGATAYLCTHSMKLLLVLAGLHALISSVAGIYINVWINGSQSAATVVAGLALFILAWLFGPADGVVSKAWHRRKVNI
ncbi:manganese transport system membrane protein MntD [Rubritalea halochordaticola]|uniref:Manganese transport system membrane protein MntD n=1 Tax=Rubritalea halochordaticola TaxID=714537 RepID=A0ABP9UVH0_9BACT